ncbi:MAG: IS110 family transposase [Acidimicrobiales bacterium]
MTTLDNAPTVVGGVDTHLDVHVAAALDHVGGLLGTRSFPTTLKGHGQLLAWLEGYGTPTRVGVEGTGAYGAGVARHLRRHGVEVVEVDRPNRQARRREGKSDPLDAVEAARAALSGRASGAAKSRDGSVEAMRVLLVARRSATRDRARAICRMRHLGFTAPDELRARLQGLSIPRLVEVATRLRPGAGDPVTASTKAALVSLARRVRCLEDEIVALDARLVPLVGATAPRLLARLGVGTVTCATLLVAAGDNPERLRSEAAFAHLCGVAPIPASSGKVVSRHRLNRGGNRQANSALWRIVVVRLSCDPETKAYVERREKEGASRREAIRSLKRYVAREVFHYLPRA